jgi:hypothetical protein
MEEQLLKALGEKIDAMKSESVSKAELIELMSKVSDLETKGADVAEIKKTVRR